MNLDIWNRVDDYVEGKLMPRDDLLAGVLQSNRDSGLPEIDVSPMQGRLLHLLVRMMGARRVLEIGTLGAYSTIWLARGVAPGGRVVTLEFWPRHAIVARRNIEAAGLSGVVEVREGRAVDSLAQLHAEDARPFDFIFIDADKASNALYIDWAVKLSRPGTVIVCDNVIRSGAIAEEADATSNDARAVFDLLGSHPRLFATVVQTVGRKGYDGFVIAEVGEEGATAPVA